MDVFDVIWSHQWDVFDYVVKKPVTKAYQCTYDLGRVAVSKTIDGAVQIPTVTKSVLTSSYALGCAAASKIDESVIRNDGVKQKVQEYLPGPENRGMMVRALTHPATQEALKHVVPGGGALAIVGSVGKVLLGKNQNQNQNQNQNDIDEQNKYEHVIKQLKVLQADNEKMRNQINKLEVMTTTNNSSSSTVSEQKPEEVITEVVVPSTIRSKI